MVVIDYDFHAKRVLNFWKMAMDIFVTQAEGREKKKATSEPYE